MTKDMFKRRLYFPLFLLILLNTAAFAQTTKYMAIGHTVADPSAILDISSSNKGLLIPRIRVRPTPSPTAEGLLIYNLNIDGFEYWDGTTWIPFDKIAARSGALNAPAQASSYSNVFKATTIEAFIPENSYKLVPGLASAFKVDAKPANVVVQASGSVVSNGKAGEKSSVITFAIYDNGVLLDPAAVQRVDLVNTPQIGNVSKSWNLTFTTTVDANTLHNYEIRAIDSFQGSTATLGDASHPANMVIMVMPK